jgi:D-beta-D-heptose 7-phosphate kinase/D-beta-D-heptose 1-phosphate adenosyltransferase
LTSKKVLTNGCYDILHIGHIELFKFAYSIANNLHVAIDSDRRVSASKGVSRPITQETNRKVMLESIRYVDKVSIFDSDQDLETIIASNNVDYLVIGSEYKDKYIVGKHLVEKVIFFDRIPNYSTTSIIQNIADRR